MSKKTFEAPSVEAAIEKAAAELGVAAEQLRHQVVEQKQDFWGMGEDTVVIEVWEARPSEPPEQAADTAERPDDTAEPPDDAAERPDDTGQHPDDTAEQAEVGEVAAREAAGSETAEAEEVQPVDESDEGGDGQREGGAAEREEAAEQDAEEPREKVAAGAGGEAAADRVTPDDISALLAQIFHDMEFECTVDVGDEGEGFLATVSGADKEALLEGNGRCLSALELIANNAFRNRMERGTKIRVDAGDFRSRRDQELTDVAYQVAHSAKQTGRTQETQPLNPYERRLVHLALAEDPAVTTRSRGSGFLKNVQVIPQSGGRGGRGRNKRS